MGKKESSKSKNKITLESLNRDMKEIMELIENPDLSESDFMPKINAIKKKYSLYMKEEILKGTLTKAKLDKLIQIFIGDQYKDKKIFPQLNETSEMIINQYLDFIDHSGLDEKSASDLRKEVSKYHAKILGTIGTHSEKYPADYLEQIIRRKVSSLDFPLDNHEILKILNDKINSHILDDEETKKLVENAFIKPILAHKKTGQFRNYKSVGILEVLSSYAQVYKYENDFEAYEKYLRLGLDFEQFKGKVQYKEIEEAVARIPELKRKYEEHLNQLNQSKINVLHLDKNNPNADFIEVKLNASANGEGTEEELNKFIEDLSIYPGFSKLFEDDNQLPPKHPGPGKIKNHNILSNKEKIRNILLMLKKLKSNPRFKNAQISKCYVKKDVFDKIVTENADAKARSFDEYIIFPIEGLEKEVFVLECFDPIKEGSLYITNQKYLTPVISIKRARAKQFRNPKVLDFIDHKSTGYVDALTEAVIGVYDEKNTGNRKVRPEKDFTDYLASQMRKSASSTPPNKASGSNKGTITGSNPTTPKPSTTKPIPVTPANASKPTPITQNSKNVRDLVSSLGSLSLEDLYNLKQALENENKQLEESNRNNEKSVVKKIMKLILIRLKIYEKQYARSQELDQLLQQLEEEEKNLMGIIPE